MTPATVRGLAAEALGTALLVATIVGSGVMGERLAGGNVALALLANALATGAMLYVLITVLAPISGAHLNPAVSLVFALRGELGWRLLGGFVVVQCAAAVGGAWLAHAMFELPLFATAAAHCTTTNPPNSRRRARRAARTPGSRQDSGARRRSVRER